MAQGGGPSGGPEEVTIHVRPLIQADTDGETALRQFLRNAPDSELSHLLSLSDAELLRLGVPRDRLNRVAYYRTRRNIVTALGIFTGGTLLGGGGFLAGLIKGRQEGSLPEDATIIPVTPNTQTADQAIAIDTEAATEDTAEQPAEEVAADTPTASLTPQAYETLETPGGFVMPPMIEIIRASNDAEKKLALSEINNRANDALAAFQRIAATGNITLAMPSNWDPGKGFSVAIEENDTDGLDVPVRSDLKGRISIDPRALGTDRGVTTREITEAVAEFICRNANVPNMYIDEGTNMSSRMTRLAVEIMTVGCFPEFAELCPDDKRPAEWGNMVFGDIPGPGIYYDCKLQPSLPAISWTAEMIAQAIKEKTRELPSELEPDKPISQVEWMNAALTGFKFDDKVTKAAALVLKLVHADHSATPTPIPNANSMAMTLFPNADMQQMGMNQPSWKRYIAEMTKISSGSASHLPIWMGNKIITPLPATATP